MILNSCSDSVHMPTILGFSPTSVTPVNSWMSGITSPLSKQVYPYFSFKKALATLYLLNVACLGAFKDLNIMLLLKTQGHMVFGYLLGTSVWVLLYWTSSGPYHQRRVCKFAGCECFILIKKKGFIWGVFLLIKFGDCLVYVCLKTYLLFQFHKCDWQVQTAAILG